MLGMLSGELGVSRGGIIQTEGFESVGEAEE